MCWVAEQYAGGSEYTGGGAVFVQTSVAGSHANTLVVSVQKRQQKGIALGITYT